MIATWHPVDIFQIWSLNKVENFGTVFKVVWMNTTGFFFNIKQISSISFQWDDVRTQKSVSKQGSSHLSPISVVSYCKSHSFRNVTLWRQISLLCLKSMPSSFFKERTHLLRGRGMSEPIKNREGLNDVNTRAFFICRLKVGRANASRCYSPFAHVGANECSNKSWIQ